MRPRSPFALLAGSLFSLVLFTVLPAPARAGAADDGAALRRELSKAHAADRIPLLLRLADRQRENPVESLRLANEALELLALFPSTRAEAEARCARSLALSGKSDFAAALAEAQRAESLAGALREDSLRIDALCQMGLAQLSLSQWASALENAEQARALASRIGNARRLGRACTLIGRIRNAMGDLQGALEAHLAALKICDSSGDEAAAASVHNNIAGVYWDLQRFEKSLAELQRARVIHEKVGAHDALAGVLNNIGLILQELDRSPESIPYLQRGLELARTLEDRDIEAACLSNLGWAYRRMKQPDRALAYHRQALALEERIQRRDAVVRSRGALAAVMIDQRNYRAAIPWLESAVALADSIDDPLDQVGPLGELARMHALLGDTAKAYRVFQRFHEIQLALNDSTAQRHVADLEATHDALQRERDLDSARKLAAERRTQLLWLLVGSALLGASFAWLALLHRRQGRAQRRLAESEQRYRALLHTSAIPTFLIEVGTRRLLDLNEAARALSGLETGATLDAPGVPGDDWPRCALVRALDAAPESSLAIDQTWIGPDGESRWTELRDSSVAWAGRSCRLVTLRDTTDLHAEEELRAREAKMRSLGALAGGIAHDFNNALTAVVGHVALARDGTNAERREMLDLAEAAALRTRGLTSQLLAFARGGLQVRQPSDVGRLLREAVELAGAGSTMRIDVEVAEGLPAVSVDRVQFSQLVTQLVLNAHEATGEYGRLHVRASRAASVPTFDSATVAAGYVRIDFSDDGEGIPVAIRDRIFEPYFTTRPTGHGLGLATAFAICLHHGGTLGFESKEGHGTTFSAYFPATTESVEDAKPRSEASPEGSARILVLEDEPLVRLVLERALARWGHVVEAVSDGQRAVELYRERMSEGRPFDLLVMDLTIPGGMGGRAAMARILEQDPHARAIVASGYSDDPTMARFREAGFQAALSKPFRMEELARVIADVLAPAEVAGVPASARRPGNAPAD